MIKLLYPRRHLVWGGLLLFLLHLRSRLQFTLDRGSPTLEANLVRLAGTDEQAIAHGDALANFFRRVPAERVLELVQRCVRGLIRTRALNDFRPERRVTVAIDGTGLLSFDRRHCPHCLTRKLSNGGTLVHHPVLEAKQDREKNAFHRVAGRLHVTFPRTPFGLLLDALFCEETAPDDTVTAFAWLTYFTITATMPSRRPTRAAVCAGRSRTKASMRRRTWASHSSTPTAATGTRLACSCARIRPAGIHPWQRPAQPRGCRSLDLRGACVLGIVTLR